MPPPLLLHSKTQRERARDGEREMEGLLERDEMRMGRGAGMGKSSKIRHIVRLRQMLQRWRLRAVAAAARGAPADVPAGHVAVCVGSSSRRFVVRAAHLNHPVFRQLLRQAEEEYGFSSRPGPLTLPCDESLFEHILHHLSSSSSSRLLSLEDFRKSLPASSSCSCRSGEAGHGSGGWRAAEPLPLLPGGSRSANSLRHYIK